jgi:hypothetical protein
MVVTLTLAVPLPLAKTFGFTEQVVLLALIGREQERFTCEAKPLCAVTEMAFVNVAVWPAFTACVIVPVEVMEKSGGPVTVKLAELEVPPPEGFTT